MTYDGGRPLGLQPSFLTYCAEAAPDVGPTAASYGPFSATLDLVRLDQDGNVLGLCVRRPPRRASHHGFQEETPPLGQSTDASTGPERGYAPCPSDTGENFLPHPRGRFYPRSGSTPGP